MPITHLRRRAPQAGGCAFIALFAAIVDRAVGAPASFAATTSVYWDNNDNVGAGPFPFNGTFAGTDNIAIGPSMMQALTTGTYNVAWRCCRNRPCRS
jgi:hypothetical protein